MVRCWRIRDSAGDHVLADIRTWKRRVGWDLANGRTRVAQTNG